MDLTAFRAAIGDIPVQDHPRIVQQKSRDHYWYSPRLKAELENVTAQLVVTPRTQEEVRTILAAAFKSGIPVTPRGAGTGNYGQDDSLIRLDHIIRHRIDRDCGRRRTIGKSHRAIGRNIIGQIETARPPVEVAGRVF